MLVPLLPDNVVLDVPLLCRQSFVTDVIREKLGSVTVPGKEIFKLGEIKGVMLH